MFEVYNLIELIVDVAGQVSVTTHSLYAWKQWLTFRSASTPLDTIVLPEDLLSQQPITGLLTSLSGAAR